MRGIRNGKLKLFSAIRMKQAVWDYSRNTGHLEYVLPHQLTIATIWDYGTVLLHLLFLLFKGKLGRRGPDLYVNSPGFLNWQLTHEKKKRGWIK